MASFQQVLLEPPGGGGLSLDAYERIRDTLAHLSFAIGSEKGCEALRETWMKIKTSSEPPDGYPFAPNHPVFSPDDRLLRRASKGSSRGNVTDQEVLGNNGSHQMRQEPSVMQYIPDEAEELRRLLRECSASQEHAAVLHHALAYTTPQKMNTESVIREFYGMCVRDQESLVSQMGWANSKAEVSRIARGIDTPAAVRESFESGKGGNLVDEVPLPERAFDELLKANQQITEVSTRLVTSEAEFRGTFCKLTHSH